MYIYTYIVVWGLTPTYNQGAPSCGVSHHMVREAAAARGFCRSVAYK